MPEISRSRTISAKQQAVWDVLADFGGISAWADNADHSCILHTSDHGHPLGTTRRVQAGRNTLVERIVTYDAPNTIAYDIEGLPPRLRVVRNQWSLTPQGEAATRVTLTTTIDIGPRPPQQLAARIVARVFAKQSDVMLAGLAKHVENSHG